MGLEILVSYFENCFCKEKAEAKVNDEVHELLINNLTLFEGLNLSEVSAGEYLFVGLPLRIVCDGAPARAILIES